MVGETDTGKEMRSNRMKRLNSRFQKYIFAVILIVFSIGILGCRLFRYRQTGSDQNGLVGFWKLREDTRDSSGFNNHGVNHLVKFDPRGFAVFNGKGSYIEIPSNPSIDLGSSPFTISTWVDIGTSTDDVPGDIMNRYDPDSRRGFQPWITTRS